jgi:PAS domain S-box-containing protein
MQQAQHQHLFSQLANFILQHKNEIIEKWIGYVQDESEIKSSNNLTHKQLVDHMPELFKELSCYLQQQPDHNGLRDARTHGYYRWKQGYKLDEVLREFGLFRIVLLEYIADFIKQTPDITPSIEIEARKRIHKFLNDASRVSAQQYAKEQELETRKYYEALEKSENLLRLATETTGIGIWDWNPLTGETNWSDRCKAIFGAPSEAEMSYELFLSMVHPEDRERVHQAVQSSLDPSSKGNYKIEYRTLTLEDGIEHWVAIDGQTFFNDMGQTVRFIGTALDITERKQAEITLARLAAIVESSDDAIIGKTLDGIITSWNRSAERIFGYTAEEIIGRPISILIPPDRYNEESEIIEKLKHGESVNHHFETIRICKDGKRIYISLSVSPIKDSSGRVIGASKIARDITKRKLLEQERARLMERERQARTEAEKANRAKDEFLAMVSHELRTPLNAMLGWSRLLRVGTLDELTTKRAIETIVRNVKAQERLINDLLDVGRIIAGKLHIEFQPVDLVTVIETAIESMRPLAESKDIKINLSLDPLAGPVSGDPSRLQQVIMNLVSNSIKFTPNGGRINIRIAHSYSHNIIRVSDTGKGISPDFLPHIFERFRQAEMLDKQERSGLGLGLAIAHYIVELHGGTIVAESKGEGQGATFTVNLPIA